MTYELAKKLKDAGFPNSEKWRDTGTYIILDEDDSYPPTFSELIEACGDGFYQLHKQGERFYASDGKSKIGYSELLKGTPEEAVANLWLELNK